MLDAQKNNRYSLYIAVLLLTGLLVRIGLLYIRWINPDEGAHMMDARMVLDGLLPIVDYESRQPFYVFSIALLFKVFGVHYWVGRLLPMIATLGTGFMMYLIGRRMFNDIVGLLASAVYLFLPLSLAWSVIVKSETLAVFLGSISIFFVLRAVDQNVRNAGWMMLAGMFSALAYYSRQLSIYLPVIIILYFLIRKDMRSGQKAALIFQYILGYLAICVTFGGFFMQSMGLQEVLFSQLNPLNLVYFNILHIFGALPQELQVAESSGIRVLNQDIQITITQWEHIFYFTLYILVGAFAVGVRIFMGSNNKNTIKAAIQEKRYNYILLLLWIVFVTLPYIAQSFVRGFYTSYFMEFLPPLILLASVYFEVVYRKVGLEFFKFMGLALVGYYFFFFLQKAMWKFYPGVGVYMLLGAIVASFGLYFFSRKWDLKVLFVLNLASTMIIGILNYSLVVAGLNQLLALLITMFVLYFVIKYLTVRLVYYGEKKAMAAFVRIYIVIVAFVISGAFSGLHIGPKYNSVWSPKTVNAVSKKLDELSQANDQVMSGGSIWGVSRILHPFMGKTHPTEFLKQAWPDFEQQFQEKRPRFIVVDGYTEKKFYRFWSIIEKEIHDNYVKVSEYKDSEYPVILYKLKDELIRSESFLVLQNS